MLQRGRKSGASLTVIGPKGIETVRRPEPPDELTSEQAAEWHAIVTRMPADWFSRESHGLLVQYCRLVSRSRSVAKLIQKYEKRKNNFDQEEYRKLLQTENMISRALATLATRMRMNQSSSSSTFQRRNAKRQNPIGNPWEDDEQEE